MHLSKKSCTCILTCLSNLFNCIYTISEIVPYNATQLCKIKGMGNKEQRIKISIHQKLYSTIHSF